MQNQTQKVSDKKKKGNSGEAIFCLFLLLLAIFEVVLLAVVLGRALRTEKNDPVLPNNEESGSQEETEAPVAALPVFSGGVIPTLPTANAATKTISGIYSQYAVLINAETGEIVAQTNPDAKFQPASLTKVMTLIVACENLTEDDLDRKLILTQELWDHARTGTYEDASVAGHDVNDEIKIRDLLYGIGVQSAADCTVMIMHEVAGSEEAFVALMNAKVAEMGLVNTHFDNAIGHESENNYTTAKEMAAIMMYAMQSELIEDILSVTQHVFQVSYYDDAGVYKDFRFTYYSTLFRSRMDTYKKYAGKEFALSTVTLQGGKTGSFITSSYIVCVAKAKSGGEYILVLGEANKTDSAPASYYTMCDIKTVFDTYIK